MAIAIIAEARCSRLSIIMNGDIGNPASSGRHIVIKAAPRITASGNPISTGDNDNPIMMEARLREIISSVNQLVRSNRELDEALNEAHDDDLLDALKENEALIHRKILEATSIAAALNEHGVHISLADKITQYDGSSVLKKLESEEKEDQLRNSDGMYL